MSHGAADSATGYLYQCRYALLAAIQEGFKRPNLEISIEHFDDVSFEKDGTPIALIQTKHHIARRGSLTNASKDLWKTLHIWAKLVNTDSTVSSRTQFLLITTSIAPADSAASFLRGTARDESCANTLLMRTAQKSTSTTNAPYYKSFSDLTESDRIALLRSITVFDQAPDILGVESELDRILRPGAPIGKVKQLRERLEGWWFSRVMSALSQDPISIPFTEIELQLDELRENFTRDSLPVDFADINPPPEIVESYQGFPFVQQLHLIKVGEKRIWFATRDYYRAFEQRSRWVREHLLVSNEIGSYDRQLVEAWEPRFEEMRERINSRPDLEEREKAGGEIYKWVESVNDIPLRGVRARFLCHGSFHMLANRCAIGWHPDYEDLIRPHLTNGDTKE